MRQTAAKEAGVSRYAKLRALLGASRQARGKQLLERRARGEKPS